MEKSKDLRPDFENFKNTQQHWVREYGKKEYVKIVNESHEIWTLYSKGWVLECLYVLAMTDYISRISNLPRNSEYDSLRKLRLDNPVYPAGIYLLASVLDDEEYLSRAMSESIEEFQRHNIVEKDVFI